MFRSVTLTNVFHEKLHVLVEGKTDAKTTIVFVHGFATDLHETAGYFDDLSDTLKSDYRIVRFDFSGCGLSEGRTEDVDYNKHANDLEVVLQFVRRDFGGQIYILAQSMGTFITSLLCPKDVQKTVFTGLPNANTEYIRKRFVDRFGGRDGAKIDFDGISLLPRSSGITQKIGSTFWKTLRNFDPVASVREFAKHTKLLIVHPKQDDIVGSAYLEEYATIPNIHRVWLDGDHNFSNSGDRMNLIANVKKFFK